MSLHYEDSKEIFPSKERADMRFLGLARVRLPDTSLVFRLIASSSEKPKILRVGEVMYHPDTFRDAREARELYDSIESLYDFNKAVENFRRV